MQKQGIEFGRSTAAIGNNIIRTAAPGGKLKRKSKVVSHTSEPSISGRRSGSSLAAAVR
jgi:hypothetical protein